MSICFFIIQSPPLPAVYLGCAFFQSGLLELDIKHYFRFIRLCLLLLISFITIIQQELTDHLSHVRPTENKI